MIYNYLLKNEYFGGVFMRREEIENNYKNVELAINNNDFVLASLSIRHIIEMMLQEYINKFSPENTYDDVFSKINSLEAKGILNKQTANIYHTMRQLGNRGAHYTENGGLTREELERSLAPLRRVIDEYYVNIENDININPVKDNYNNNVNLYLRNHRSDKISELYGLAHNAYDNQLYGEAEKYYQKILSYDEMEYVAAYFLNLCKALQAPKLSTSAEMLSKILPNIFYRILLQVNDEELLLTYYREVAEQVINLEEEIAEIAWKQYKGKSMSERELHITRLKTAYALYTIGQQIEKTKKALNDLIIKAWKIGIEIHNIALEDMTISSRFSAIKDINIIANKIKLYDSTYIKPRYKGNDIFILGVVVITIILIVIVAMILI